ncbi:flagellar protein FlgN [uncultured Anaerovibrio sp.]|uniref:flagellar protein FlgN n=1 Tax=uncultured Anaerovibrio sp. TaxID=361586 RepID=UPI0026184CE9|nr:flagellar protein FlgN [uncultured Anaerovibrio sp.]
MKDIIDILRQQLLLLSRLLELVQIQREKLIKIDAEAARRLSAEIEPVMIDISSLDKRRDSIMSDLKVKDFGKWLKDQPNSPDKEVLSRLLAEEEKILHKLKEINSQNMQFLDRHSEFIDYSINVMTQTSAGVTYGTPNNGGMPVQGRKMFDTGV